MVPREEALNREGTRAHGEQSRRLGPRPHEVRILSRRERSRRGPVRPLWKTAASSRSQAGSGHLSDNLVAGPCARKSSRRSSPSPESARAGVSALAIPRVNGQPQGGADSDIDSAADARASTSPSTLSSTSQHREACNTSAQNS